MAKGCEYLVIAGRDSFKPCNQDVKRDICDSSEENRLSSCPTYKEKTKSFYVELEKDYRGQIEEVHTKSMTSFNVAKEVFEGLGYVVTKIPSNIKDHQWALDLTGGAANA